MSETEHDAVQSQDDPGNISSFACVNITPSSEMTDRKVMLLIRPGSNGAAC